MDIKNMVVRYKRGDKHPGNARLFFLRYDNRRQRPEVWGTEKQLASLLNWERKRYPELFASRKSRYHSDPVWKEKQIRSVIAAHRKNKPACKQARDKWRAKPGSLEKAKRAYNKWVNSPKGRIVKRQVYARYLATTNGIVINRIRSRIAVALKKGFTKSASTLELVGCSMLDLRAHLEHQFVEGMSWDNIGRWEIDHITPLSAFDMSDPAQQKLAFRYTNCRPVWKDVNRQKSDKIKGELFRGRELRNVIKFRAA